MTHIGPAAAEAGQRALCVDGSDVEVGIGELSGLDLSALRERWLACFGSEAPIRMSRELIARALAHRMQEDAFGGLKPTTRRRLLADSPPSTSKRAKPVRSDRWIKPGTRLLREWAGRVHEVTVREDGQFLYLGEAHRSLSIIARRITGTQWSGPAFFGLKRARKNDARP